MPEPTRRRFASAVLAGLVLAAAAAPPASAAPATITAAANRFTPSDVTIAANEAVTWSFTEASHNVKGTGWSGNDSFAKATFTRAFPAAGSFTFVCEAHPVAMQGTVTVTAAAADPVADPATGAPSTVAPRVPAAAGGLAGDVLGALPGTAWLVAQDLRAPILGELHLTLPAGRARPHLSVRVSEDALIVARVRRAGDSAELAPVKRRATMGLNRFALGSAGLRAGRYTLRIGAIDAAGNESPLRTRRLRVQRTGR